ncbi:MAG: DUF2716 domain-containing protein [Gemmataceae bacterium]
MSFLWCRSGDVNPVIRFPSEAGAAGGYRRARSSAWIGTAASGTARVRRLYHGTHVIGDRIPRTPPPNVPLGRPWLRSGTVVMDGAGCRRRASVERVEGGWTPIADAENEELWATFTTRFSFRRSVSRSEGPAIKEPAPFVTWSVSGVRELYAMDAQQFRAIEWRSREQLLQALVGLGNLVGRMYALDLNHAGHSFDPNVVAHRSVDKWPVPLIPIHNYSLFVDPTFSVGLFSDPWEESICVFGESLVEQLVRNPLPCFGDVIRSSARTSS